MRFRLRTLLILLAVLPPLVAAGRGKYLTWRAEQERQSQEEQARQKRAIARARAVAVVAQQKARTKALQARLAAMEAESAVRRGLLHAEREEERADPRRRSRYGPPSGRPPVPQPKAPAKAGDMIDVEHGKGP